MNFQSSVNNIYLSFGLQQPPLSTALGDFYLSFAPNWHWQNGVSGTFFIIDDTERKSQFIQIYELQNKRLFLEQEITTGFQYDARDDSFFILKSDEHQTGLQFSNSKYGSHFVSTVKKILFKKVLDKTLLQGPPKKVKSTPPESQSSADDCPPPVPKPRLSKSQTMDAEDSPMNAARKSLPRQGRSFDETATRSQSFSLGRKKLSSADISEPTDFRHVKSPYHDHTNATGVFGERVVKEPPTQKSKKKKKQNEIKSIGSPTNVVHHFHVSHEDYRPS